MESRSPRGEAQGLSLSRLGGRFAVCRGEPGQAVDPPLAAVFWSLTRTATETSVVCARRDAPKGFVVEDGWSALAVDGTLEFELVGVLAGLTAALAAAELSVFAVSTFDTDVLMVRTESLELAVAALEARGYEVS